MIDNQSAEQPDPVQEKASSEGGMAGLLRLKLKDDGPGDMVSMLGRLGVSPERLKAPRTDLTGDEQNQLFIEGVDRAFDSGEYNQYTLAGPMAEATMKQVGIPDAISEFTGGVIGEINALLNFRGQLLNTATNWTTGKDYDEVLPGWLYKSIGLPSNPGMSGADAIEAQLPEGMSAQERMASIGGESVARDLGGAGTQVMTAIGLSLIPGGQAAATANTARASGVVGRLLGPVKQFVRSPGGKLYMGYMGGRQMAESSKEYREYVENQNKYADMYNEALDYLELPFDKIDKDEYSLATDVMTSVGSGAMTAASELIGTGFSVMAGRRIGSRLLPSVFKGNVADRVAYRGMGGLIAQMAKGGVTASAMEGFEEVVDGFGQAVIRGWYSEFERGRFLRTGDPGDLWKTIQQHAPDLAYQFAIAATVTLPLGIGGSLAVARRDNRTLEAFAEARLRDRLAEGEGVESGVADHVASKVIYDHAMGQGDKDQVAIRAAVQQLRGRMEEVGNVTEDMLMDPEFAARFVEAFPELAFKIGQSESLSRTQLQWLTGQNTTSSGARQAFLDRVRRGSNDQVGAYVAEWVRRSDTRLKEIRGRLAELNRDNSEEGRSERTKLSYEASRIQSVREGFEDLIAAREQISGEEFRQAVEGLSVSLEGIDPTGSADATQDSRATEQYESGIPDQEGPTSADLRRLARQGDSDAALELARRHETGDRAEPHEAKARYWFNVAMSQAGDTDAMVYLGMVYEGRIQAESPGAPRSINKARDLYRRAFEMGNDEAGRLLGELEQRLAGPAPRARADAATSRSGPSAGVQTPQAPREPEATREAPKPPRRRRRRSVDTGGRVPRSAVSEPQAETQAPPRDPVAEATASRVEEGRRQAEQAERAEASRQAEAEQAELSAEEQRLNEEVAKGAKRDDLRVRIVGRDTDTPLQKKVRAAAKKLGRKVEFIRITQEESRPGQRRRRSPSGIRGFVSRNSDTIYIVAVTENQASRLEQDVLKDHYLQTLLHEVAHGLVQDKTIREQVEQLLTKELADSFRSRFMLGDTAEEIREELAVYTLTQDIVGSSGVGSLLLSEGMSGKVAAALKQAANSVKVMLTGQQRKELLNSIIRDRIASKKKAKPISKENPAREVMGQARAATPKPQAEPKKTGGDQQGTLFMRERNSPQDRQRIAELAETIDLFDERGYGTLSHPVDGNDVDAEAIIGDLLAYSAKVPRKYLKGTEEFEYLASAIHRVLIEKSADSTDYERAAAVMSNALGEGIADYDQIVVAARRMGWEGTDKQVPFDIVSEEDVDPRRLMELMDDPDGFADSGPRFMRERFNKASIRRLLDSISALDESGAIRTAMFWEMSNLERAIQRYREELGELADDLNPAELYQLAGGKRIDMVERFDREEIRPFEEKVADLAKRSGMSELEVRDLIQEYAYVVHARDANTELQQRSETERRARAQAKRNGVTEVLEGDELEAMLEQMSKLGISNEEAIERQKQLDAEFDRIGGDWAGAVEMLRSMNRRTLEMRRDAGLITQASYDTLIKRYPSYVPIVRSVFGEEGEVDAGTSRPKKREMRSLRGGNEATGRTFWAASYAITKHDRLVTAHRIAMNEGHMAFWELAMQGALKTQDGTSLADAVFVDQIVQDAVRRARATGSTRTGEDGKPVKASEFDQGVEVGKAITEATADIDSRMMRGENESPDTVRFKLTRDVDLTDPQVLRDIEDVTSSKDGLTSEERAEGMKPRTQKQREKKLEQLERQKLVYKKGSAMHFRINDPILANAMLNRTPTMMQRAQEKGGLVGKMSNAWMALMNYQRFAYVTASPGFIVGEMFRSPQQVAIMARVLADKYRLPREQAEQLFRNLELEYAKMFFTVPVVGAARSAPFVSSSWKSVKHVLKGGKPRDEYEELIAEAVEAGVLQGGIFNVDSYEQMSAKLRREIADLADGTTKSHRKHGRLSKAGQFAGWVEMVTTALDMSNRMQLYRAAREAGLSKQKAAVMARESTIDFGKKGSFNRGANELYLFFNPRMQGIHQLLRAFKQTSRGRLSTTAAVLGRYFLYAFLLKMVVEMFFEDDENPDTWLGKFASMQNTIIPIPGTESENGQYMYFEINNPYGFGAIAKLAYRFGDVLMGDSRPGDLIVGGVGDVMSELTPVQFDGMQLLKGKREGLESFLAAVTPTNFQPLVSAFMNRDWKGAPIAPLGPEFGAGENRESLDYWPDTMRTSIWASQGIAELTGVIMRALQGPQARGVEISPNKLGYIFERYLPGVARQFGDLIKTVGQMSDGTRRGIGSVPVVNLVIGQSGGRSVLPGRFRDDLATIAANLDQDIKADGLAPTLERYGNLGWLAGPEFSAAKRQLKKLQEARNNATERGDRVRATKLEDRMNEIRKRMLIRAAKMRNR